MLRFLLAFALLVQTQTPADLVIQLQADLDRLKVALQPPPPPVVVIATPQALDAALAAAKPGDVLTLSPALVYPYQLTLRAAVTLQAETLPAGRMDAATPLPSFLAGIVVPGDGVVLRGLQVQHPRGDVDLVTVTGSHVTLDRMRILGDPVRGAKRGIAANGADLSILRSYIDDCFSSYPGPDTQAILAWDTPGPILINDNFLRGGSETVMLGGADPSSEANIPSDVIIRNNTITSRPEWQQQLVGVKSRLELKAGRRVLIENNVVEYVWGGHGQDGFAISLTVRNQDGRAPYSTIEDIVIQHNTFQHAAGAINILATDNQHPSQRLARVTFSANSFFDIDPKKYTGSPKLIQIGAGPLSLSLTGNTFDAAVNSTSTIYFYGAMADDLTVTLNTFPKTKYGVFGDGASTGFDAVSKLPKAWIKFVASGTFSGNIETP